MPPRDPPLEARVLRFIRRLHLITPGDTIICATSGGADSMALLRFLYRRRELLDIRLEVAHLHHGIPEARSDEAEALVRETAAQLALPCHVLRVDVPRFCRRAHLGLEAGGRLVRLRWFGRLTARRSRTRVATGHTADDQAETLLHRLLRGTGVGGAASIRPGLSLDLRGLPMENGADPSAWTVIRPFLAIRRHETRAYAMAESGRVVEDPTNQDPTFMRNRIRLELLPLLENHFQPSAVEALSRFAASAREDGALLDRMAWEIFSTRVSLTPEGWLVDHRLGKAERPLRMRVWSRLLQAAAQEVDGDRLDRLDDLLAGRPGRSVVYGSFSALRTYHGVEAGLRASTAAPLSLVGWPAVEVPMDGEVLLPTGHVVRTRLAATGGEHGDLLEPVGPPGPGWQALLDAEIVRAAGPLYARPRSDGDRWVPPGGTRERKLKATFNRWRVPPAQRQGIPLLTAGGQVVCVAGHGVDERFGAGLHTRLTLQVQFFPTKASDSVHNDIVDILLTEEQIQTRVRELAAEITRDYEGREIILVAVLRGAIMFLSDLSRNIHLSTIVDFMVAEKISKPDGHAEVKIIKDLDNLVTGKDVLIVEDIIDEGRTLSYLVEALRIREPASLKIVTIFDKPEGRQVPISADYVGFTIPDRFVVGYGLDYRQRYRNLPVLGVLKREVYEGHVDS